ncbi:MAG TPA: xanthine dehydrogenase family protein molybdopterin-binding subunit [Stellaceae bacterium]|nr:xanthine dehydrogenase family protein molybdopterin-binding subunit [Stellaceae bacterium]
MGQFGIGQSVPREEDPRLLRGQGDYIADMSRPNQAYGYVLRSPHAHARIRSIDTRAAQQMPGVLGVFTEADLKADGIGTTKVRMPRRRPDGTPIFSSPHPGLARSETHFVGDPVAYVVAESLAAAKDAAERVLVDYEPLPSVVLTGDAVKPGAPSVWENCPDNISNLFELGDKAAVDAAFAEAHHVTRQHFVISRIMHNAIEPRGCIGEYDARYKRFTLYGCIGSIHSVRRAFAEDIFKLPENRFRVVAGDIGGAFGSKGNTAPENTLALYAARKLGRPVKWIAERSECFLSDDHCRDNVTEAELALDQDGKFLALRVKTLANLGAYLSADTNLLPTFANLGTLAGVYKTPAIHVTVLGVFTNTTATAPYRGAGRPEACYVIEGIIDRAARELGIDRVALRRRNMIPPSAMPFKTGLVYTYDSGEFEACMDEALAGADHAGFEQRRAAAKKRGKLLGLGIANAIERAAAPPGAETAEIRFDATGSVTLVVGTTAQGQSHETMYKIILSDKLGIDSDEIAFIQGDTDKVVWGTGTFGSRSATIGGSAALRAAEKIIAKGRKIAAHIFEAAEADIEFAKGSFAVAGTDKRMPLKEIARASFQPGRLPKGMEPGLFETGVYDPTMQNFPCGTHVCEIEIDEATGKIAILRYVAVDDVGVVINALTLHGQVHGGVAQGIGQALGESIVYEPKSGQLLSGSFMDYAMPRADDLCAIEVDDHPTPTATNPLGAKGAGEAGTVGALPAVMSAALDALSPLGIRHIEMPLTPERVWRAIRAAHAS